MTMERHLAVGLMSGTSLDGLDLAACEFILEKGKWRFRILEATTSSYPGEWQAKLKNLHQADALTFWKTHVAYGHYLGTKVNEFIKSTGFKADLVASHGHTVFHQPAEGITMQAGAGEAIAAQTRLPVVSDFRAADLALGGQGAPLVPIGDRLLFHQYGACLNIGGFSNISFENISGRTAFDVCPANIALNHLAGMIGHRFDRDGAMANEGRIDQPLLRKLNTLPYYTAPPPKSLGREWFEATFLPLLQAERQDVPDLLRTVCEHIGFQVGRALEDLKKTSVLVTGGGAHNSFLVNTMRKMTGHELVIPDNMIIDYKEALIFAFLGVLKRTGRTNILASVTGSQADHSGGAYYCLFPE